MFAVATMIQNSTKSLFDLCFLTRDVVSSFLQTAVTYPRFVIVSLVNVWPSRGNVACAEV